MSKNFSTQLQERNAADYADFLIPRLDKKHSVIDVGCGAGEITVGLAPYVRDITGVDLNASFTGAQDYLSERKIKNVEFYEGDAYALTQETSAFDVCFCHSTLEALENPAQALGEMYRVLKPGGVFAAASVEYSGLILNGEASELLQRFYQIRTELWQSVAKANPYFGKTLRAHMHGAGFSDIQVSTRSISYGTQKQVSEFGLARARDCDDPWYRHHAIDLGLATENELSEIAAAWIRWGSSDDAYLSFSWCRALGRKPTEK